MPLQLFADLDPAKLAVRLLLSSIPAGADSYSIERLSPSGNVAGVRGAVNVVPTGSSGLARDYEAPFDVPLTYTATVIDGGAVVATASVDFEVVYEDCKAWLVDLARPSNSIQLTVESMNELGYEIATGVHRVLNRRAPVLVSLPAWTPSTELAVLTETLSEREQVRGVLGSGSPVLLRTDPEQGIGNMYLGVTGFVEDRIHSLGTVPQRRFRAACVQVERPDPTLFAPPFLNTYDNVKASYDDYADLKTSVGTYDVLVYIDPATGAGGPITPWLPDDV